MHERFREKVPEKTSDGNRCWICGKNRKTRKIRGLKVCYVCRPRKSKERR